MSPHDIELFAAVRAVVRALDQLGVDYFVGGSIASGIHGEPRQTVDADIVAALAGRQAAPLVELLRPQFYADLPSILAATENQSSFNLIHLETMVKVDIFVTWRTDFGRVQLSRRVRRALDTPEPVEFYVATPEDTVLAKLQWYRAGGETSDRQWRDVLGVLKVQAEALDRAYLRDWAARLSLANVLRRALDEAGLPPDNA